MAASTTTALVLSRPPDEAQVTQVRQRQGAGCGKSRGPEGLRPRDVLGPKSPPLGRIRRRQCASRPSYCRVMALLAQGWFDWSRYGAVIVGAALGLVGVGIAGVVPFWRSRTHCQFGTPTVEMFMGKHLPFGSRPLPTSLVPRLRITIP